MIYLTIKELSKKTTQSFFASNILFKDINNSKLSDDVKAMAIRTLRTITEVNYYFIKKESLLNSMDKQLKSSIVSKTPSVSSAAIVSGIHLSLQFGTEMVKRWAGEIQSILKDPPKGSKMVQYHALAMLYLLKRKDLLDVAKLVTSNMSGFRSPLAHCLLIKYGIKILKSDGNLERYFIISYLVKEIKVL
jgi:coatomer protein complex subunit gamma